MDIRKAAKKDAREISKLFLAETAKRPYKQPWNEKTALQKVNELSQKGEIYVVIIERQIIGFIALIFSLGSKGKSVHIDELWIKADYQDKGIGKALMNFVEDKCKSEGITTISLISDKSSKAFGFYKKLRYKTCPEDVLMVKKLN